MKIDYHRPTSRGVTQLMYLSDDNPAPSGFNVTAFGILAIGAVIALWLTKKTAR